MWRRIEEERLQHEWLGLVGEDSMRPITISSERPEDVVLDPNIKKRDVKDSKIRP